MEFPGFHDEVREELSRVGNPTLGARIAVDRRSALDYLGIRFPVRRKIVLSGFSFSNRNESEALRIWNDLWMHSSNGDVMFCALDFYKDLLRHGVNAEHWGTIRHWIERVENWAHSDELCTIYSSFLARDEPVQWQDLDAWSQSDDEWFKRVSIVSLLRNSTKYPTYVPFDRAMLFLDRCLDDRRFYIQKAVGWVLGEFRKDYPKQVDEYLHVNLKVIGSPVLTRALERASPDERKKWRQRKKQLT